MEPRDTMARQRQDVVALRTDVRFASTQIAQYSVAALVSAPAEAFDRWVASTDILATVMLQLAVVGTARTLNTEELNAIAKQAAKE
jgi:hypothetical protein